MLNKNKISIATLNDIDEIMKFIDDEWKKGHILGVSKDYFLYEYKNKENLNFVISKNHSNKINGILGFLKSSSDINSTIWTTMWKVCKSSGSPMLGVDILNFLRKQGFRSVMSIGINFETIGIYDYLRFHVGVLDHYFIPNNKITERKISIIPDRILQTEFTKVQEKKLLSFKKLELNDIDDDFSFNKYIFRIPYKDLNYFNHRYFQHPIYHYELYGAYGAEELAAIVVVRVFEHLDSTCMRIVDFYGDDDALSSVVAGLVELMSSNGHEYIDFFCLGLSKKIILESGFIEVNCEENDIIIPNYFEPFVQKNISIKYFTDSQNLENLRIYKADGDQDRPSIMPQ